MFRSCLPASTRPRPITPPEILAIIINLAITPLHPYKSKSGRSELLASLCALNHDAYCLTISHLYHTVILSSAYRVSRFLHTVTNNTYLAGRVVNLWVGDTDLKLPNIKGHAASTENLAVPLMPNLRRFAIGGHSTSVQWVGLSCTHLTVSNLPALTHSMPTLRTLHLVNSLLSVDTLESSLEKCPALQTVVFEITELIDFRALIQLGVIVMKTVRHLRKLIFRVEDFWILHYTMGTLPARLVVEGLEEQSRGKEIRAVWSWELGIDLCGVWIANGYKRKVGKEHRISYLG